MGSKAEVEGTRRVRGCPGAGALAGAPLPGAGVAPWGMGMVMGGLSPDGGCRPQGVEGETGVPFPGCNGGQGGRPIPVAATHWPLPASKPTAWKT